MLQSISEGEIEGDEKNELADNEDVEIEMMMKMRKDITFNKPLKISCVFASFRHELFISIKAGFIF